MRNLGMDDKLRVSLSPGIRIFVSTIKWGKNG